MIRRYFVPHLEWLNLFRFIIKSNYMTLGTSPSFQPKLFINFISTMNSRKLPVSAIKTCSPPISKVSMGIQNVIVNNQCGVIIKDEKTIKINVLSDCDEKCSRQCPELIDSTNENNLTTVTSGTSMSASTSLMEDRFDCRVDKIDGSKSYRRNQDSLVDITGVTIKDIETDKFDVNSTPTGSLSKSKPITKSKTVLPQKLLDKVTLIVRLAYENNELISFNKSHHCNKQEESTSLVNQCYGRKTKTGKCTDVRIADKVGKRAKNYTKSLSKTGLNSNGSKTSQQKEMESSTNHIRHVNSYKPIPQKSRKAPKDTLSYVDPKLHQRKKVVKGSISKSDCQSEKVGKDTMSNSDPKMKNKKKDLKDLTSKLDNSVRKRDTSTIETQSSTNKTLHCSRKSTTNTTKSVRTSTEYTNNSKKDNKCKENNLNTAQDNKLDKKRTDIKTKNKTSKMMKKSKDRKHNNRSGISSHNIEEETKSHDAQNIKEETKSQEDFLSRISPDVLVEDKQPSEGIFNLKGLFDGTLDKKYEKSKKTWREDKHDRSSERRKSPNYFVAIQITNEEIRNTIGQVQRIMCDSNELLKSAMISLPTLHLTMRVACLENDEHLSRMKAALDQCADMFNKEDKEILVLDLMGIDNFRNNVVFASVTKDNHLCRVNKLSEILEQCCQENNVPPSDGKGFKPHITIAKLSKVSFKIKKKENALRHQTYHHHLLTVRKIEPSSYAAYQDHSFGKQLVTGLQLCSMMEPKNKDGYYQVKHVSLLTGTRNFSTLSEDRYTIHDIAYILVTTALSDALTSLENECLKATAYT